MKLVLNNTFKSGSVLYKQFEVVPPVKDLQSVAEPISELSVDYNLDDRLIAVFATTPEGWTLDEAILVMQLEADVDPFSDKADRMVMAELFQKEPHTISMEATDYALELLALMED